MRPATTAKVGAFGEALAAHGHGVRAARVETATRGWVDEAGNLAACCERGFVAIGAEALGVGGGGDEELGIGVFGTLNYLVAGAAFDHLPGVHDEGVFGEVASTGNVVGDKEQGQMLFLF